MSCAVSRSLAASTRGIVARITLRVAAELAPAEVAEAHRMMAAGGLRGRAVLVF